MDTELFELCKDVYKRTGWDRYTLDGRIEQYIEKAYFTIDGILQDSVVERYKLLKEQFVCPFYTSDYLLEKMPKTLNDQHSSTVGAAWNGITDDWQADYGGEAFDGLAMVEHSDTPLKALLKLTVALDDAGELK
jgi:hypothetical protein